MSYSLRTIHRGVTLIELLVVIGIMLILVALTMRMFGSANEKKALDTEAQHVVSELNRARSFTLSSKNAHAFGIHFATTSMTLFQGTYEVASSSNDVILLNKLVQVASTSFAGGGSNVLFVRLSGETTQSGTITLSLKSDTTVKKTVTIYATGLVDTH